MTILVTGAGGFVGLALVEHLLGEGHEIVALDARALPRAAREAFERLPGHLEEVACDIGRIDPRDLLKSRGITRIFHGAAITLGPAGTIAPAETVIDVNTVSTAALLEAAAEEGVARFVYPSSSAVYGPAAFGETPVTEDTESAPAGLYGFTKLASERLVVAAAARHGLSAVRARITAVFGPWEHETGVRETMSPPFQVVRTALAGEEVRLHSGGHRDWTSSRDVARALARLLTADRLPSDLYNLSCGETWHPALACEALAAHLPHLRWSVDATPNVAYNDDLARRRVPVSGARFERDFGFRFASPGEAVADYAAWAVGMGAADLARLSSRPGGDTG